MRFSRPFNEKRAICSINDAMTNGNLLGKRMRLYSTSHYMKNLTQN
jgi:hypothetical protein